MNGFLSWLYPHPNRMDATWSEAWIAGGWAMYPLLLLAIAGLMAVAALLLTSASRRARFTSFVPVGVVAALGLLVIACGLIGQQSGLSNMEEALMNVNPVDQEAIRAQGTSEAGVPMRTGLLFGVPLLLSALFLLPRVSGGGTAAEAAPPPGA